MAVSDKGYERVRRPLSVGVNLWNKWVPVRVEHCADGTHQVFFGIGKVWWRR